MIVKKYIIAGESMSPMFNPKDVILASSLPYLFKNPKINDVIICKDPRSGKTLVKRIQKVDNNEYFVTGDNKSQSTDSKTFGYIKRIDIAGQVVYKFS